MKQPLRIRRVVKAARPTPARQRAAAPDTVEHNRQAVAHALGHAVQPKLALGRGDDPQDQRPALQLSAFASAPPFFASTSWMIEISALSPWRGPTLNWRV